MATSSALTEPLGVVSAAALARLLGPARLGLAVVCLGLSSACGPSDLEAVATGLNEALFSVQGTLDDLWLVGADRGNGPAIYRLSGSGAEASWEGLDSGVTADLWWVLPLKDEVVFVGSQGMILEYNRGSGTFASVPGTDSSHTFFGVWGASSEDLWVVGGVVESPQRGSIWHRQDGVWSLWSDPIVDAASEGALWFKVHGTEANDLWVVGSQGRSLHWDGISFEDVPTGLDAEPLFTVVDRPSGAIAVGGAAVGRILHEVGGSWSDVSPSAVSPINGVCAAGDDVRAVGSYGTYYSLAEGSWEGTSGRPTLQDFHACWLDLEGNLFAVGGHISGNPLNNGIVFHAGPAPVPEWPW